MIVQNMPGGGGLVGANYLYNVAKPDGLTILAVSRATIWIRWSAGPRSRLIFVLDRQFQQIADDDRLP